MTPSLTLSWLCAWPSECPRVVCANLCLTRSTSLLTWQFTFTTSPTLQVFHKTFHRWAELRNETPRPADVTRITWLASPCLGLVATVWDVVIVAKVRVSAIELDSKRLLTWEPRSGLSVSLGRLTHPLLAEGTPGLMSYGISSGGYQYAYRPRPSRLDCELSFFRTELVLDRLVSRRSIGLSTLSVLARRLLDPDLFAILLTWQPSHMDERLSKI